MEESQSVKLTLRLDARIHAAIQNEGQTKGRDIGEHIQRVLTEYAINQHLLDEATGAEYEMKESLLDRVAQTALKIVRDGRFGPDIILQVVTECMDEKQFAADYEAYVKDNPYKHGNPRKSPINKEIGSRIRKVIGGKVAKLSDGKPAKIPVAGSIIQSYTKMKSFNC